MAQEELTVPTDRQAHRVIKDLKALKVTPVPTVNLVPPKPNRERLALKVTKVHKEKQASKANLALWAIRVTKALLVQMVSKVPMVLTVPRVNGMAQMARRVRRVLTERLALLAPKVNLANTVLMEARERWAPSAPTAISVSKVRRDLMVLEVRRVHLPFKAFKVSQAPSDLLDPKESLARTEAMVRMATRESKETMVNRDLPASLVRTATMARRVLAEIRDPREGRVFQDRSANKDVQATWVSPVTMAQMAYRARRDRSANPDVEAKRVSPVQRPAVLPTTILTSLRLSQTQPKEHSVSVCEWEWLLRQRFQ